MRKRPSTERIAKVFREFQADLDSGLDINQACRKAGFGITTYDRWNAIQENPVSNEQLRVSEPEAENGRLKLLVAELALDTRMLYAGSFHSKLRDEFLDREGFESPTQAQAMGSLWKEKYNTERPHSFPGLTDPGRVCGHMQEVRAYRREPGRATT